MTAGQFADVTETMIPILLGAYFTWNSHFKKPSQNRPLYDPATEARQESVRQGMKVLGPILLLFGIGWFLARWPWS